MSQHRTKSKVVVSEWCKRCGMMMTHYVSDNGVSFCLTCMKRTLPVQPTAEPKQPSLLDKVEEVQA